MENRDTPSMKNWDKSMGFCVLGASGGTQRENKERSEPPVGKVGNFHFAMEQRVSAGVSKKFSLGIPAGNSHRGWRDGEDEEGGMTSFQVADPIP